jgi:hypothetical protein
MSLYFTRINANTLLTLVSYSGRSGTSSDLGYSTELELQKEELNYNFNFLIECTLLLLQPPKCTIRIFIEKVPNEIIPYLPYRIMNFTI